MRSARTKKGDESLTFLHVFEAGHMAPPWISQMEELAPELAALSQKLTEASQAIKLRKREQEELTARERSLQDKLSEVAEGIKLSLGNGGEGGSDRRGIHRRSTETASVPTLQYLDDWTGEISFQSRPSWPGVATTDT